MGLTRTSRRGPIGHVFCPYGDCGEILTVVKGGYRCGNCLQEFPDPDPGFRLSRSRESKEHDELKAAAEAWLKKQGYKTEIEAGFRLSRPIKIRGDRDAETHIKVDVVGYKGRHSIAIECGDVKRPTLDALYHKFDQIFRWRHGKKEPKLVVRGQKYPGLRLTPVDFVPQGNYR